jgi:hypothetical protein
MIWPAMQNGITNYWDVHTMQHNKFYLSLLLTTIEPQELLLFHDCYDLKAGAAIIFKYSIQMGISFHTLLDEASHSLISCHDPGDETKHVLLY